MAFDPKNAVDAAKDIATHAVEKAADIVEDAGHILKGDIAGGVGQGDKKATRNATYAVDKAKEVLSGVFE